MSLLYPKALPIDASSQPMQEFPAPYLALEEDLSENNTASSVITLTDNTTIIEVGAFGTGAALKWISTTNTNPSVVTAAGATADFDHAIAPNTIRRFVVPIETAGNTSVVGANKRNGLYNRIAVKSVGIGSVLTTQY